MKTVCDKDMCTGCMACIQKCSVGAIHLEDSLDAYNAVIDANKCINCVLCYKICQQNNDIELLNIKKWYQGWAKDAEVRQMGSSGGIATEVAHTFIEKGGVVCSCVFNEGRFIFDFAYNSDEVNKFSGSKYVKSDASLAYNQILKLLKNNSKVLFIALPCQVAALKLFVGAKFQERLYTIDLICHGTPSSKVLDCFLLQYKMEMKDIKDIRFRLKTNMQIRDGEKGIEKDGIIDRYMIAFLNSLIYTKSCYSCKYAKRKRVSDITLGDSWGSSIFKEEHQKGLSLVLCQTEKGIAMLKESSVHLEDVDLENAILHNHQLQHPSIKPNGYEDFWKKLKKHGNFNQLVFKELPKDCLKQDIKKILTLLKLYHGGGD